MGFKRYENQNLHRIEKLLEKLLLHFENMPEEREIKRALSDIEENKAENTIRGSDFL